MKHRILTAACMAICLATSAQVMAGVELPAMDVWIHPSPTTTSDEVSITLSGIWPDTCIPEQIPIAVFAGDSVWIDILLPGWDDPNNCGSLSCTPDPTPFEVKGIAGYMAAGYYDVYARVISCDERGQYRAITGFEVTEGKPAEPGCTECLAYRFGTGSRVALLQDNPPGGFGLKAGHGGTVICRDCRTGCGRLLVSWDLWTGGDKDIDGCGVNAPLGYPSTSGMWVDLGKVMIGRPFNRIGRVYKGLEGCLTFVADNGLRFNILATGNMYRILEELASMSTGNRVRLQGLLNDTCPKSDESRICPQYAGDIHHPIVSECRDVPDAGSGICDMDLLPGDRVELLVDRPMGAGGGPAVDLYAGAMGTVICTDSTDDELPFYVSWDDWTNGTDTDYFCDSIVVPYIPGSGWWMRCDEVRLVYRVDP